ncbi:cytochrome-c oxidase, cbb3-type subunit III [Consotaella salsifontis]|uniref:Cbb3-type cytochrome c oxidase subunit n=1 Tax=Consotaella salsifontis TaxID=1365950 RepID=A0A1T4SXD0_9HYPH|nr:cytochrome-c oxidase, cbb3-type subunit III [Consotaella salsifontis]SKA32568.1 cytochrome c oxidase cbb3-type subunit 3 [Consotaella salsifontis]
MVNDPVEDAHGREVDAATGTETTGHSWDGIKELNTPLPRWWLWTFYGTILFSIVYVVLYPAIPLVHSATSGVLGWNSRDALKAEVAEATQEQAQFRDQIAAATPAEVVQNADLFRFASAAGRSAFAVNCVQCHGAGATGGPGYPNLQDDDWLWGGTIDDIVQTISYGVRSGSDETRFSEMPAFGRDGILDAEQIENVSAYVLSLSGQKASSGDATAGQQVFADNCTACHGENGQGMHELGAPNLSDGIWLYGGKQSDIIAQVTGPRHGVMPAWLPRLGETTVKELAAYVYSLGGATVEQASAQ